MNTRDRPSRRDRVGYGDQRPGADIAEYASAAGLLERVELQGEVLIVGGDARVADQMAAGRAAPARGAAARSGGRGEFRLWEAMAWAIVSEVSDAGVAARADHETGF